MEVTASVGNTSVRVWRDVDQRKGFAWEMAGYEANREAAFEAVEKALLGSLSTSEQDLSWIRELTRMAIDGTAYLMVDGDRDMRSLLPLCKLALEGLQRAPELYPPPKLRRRYTKKKKETPNAG